MAATILIHSVSWLRAVLVADPQRLKFGSPWYLTVALGIGTIASYGLGLSRHLNKPGVAQ